jgi:hypothetical protein
MYNMESCEAERVWHALEIWSSQYKFMLCLQLDMFELSATLFVEGGVTLWRK